MVVVSPKRSIEGWYAKKKIKLKICPGEYVIILIEEKVELLRKQTEKGLQHRKRPVSLPNVPRYPNWFACEEELEIFK